MPRDTSIKKVLIIGSGPIVIGQACEFDYSGTQACRALREEGIQVVLINSNPATIMTDPAVADRTYVEPITPETIERIIEKERPDSVLPTLGGQTALNVAMDMAKSGAIERLGVRILGADPDVIDKAENRQRFKDVVVACGLECPRSFVVHTLQEAMACQKEVGLPAIIRPSFTLGGTGGGIAYNVDEYAAICEAGLRASPVSEILVEESVIGWKEFELEVVRDRKDNCIIVCSIENVDPMGVHTGDSITVAPALTLTDREYHRMRDAAFAIMRAVGVECGGSNVQFAADPATGRQVVIEMNPRVSRSSALASKATGFPIARIAAKLAIGYTLDELQNDITRSTPASFEPAIDYIVTKIPRFDMEKFPGADTTLTTAMKSVGEAMAIGRTFKESLQKALRSLERGRAGLGLDRHDRWGRPDAPTRAEIVERLTRPNNERLHFVRYALLAGFAEEEVTRLTRIDPWFVSELAQLVRFEEQLRAARGRPLAELADLVLEAKRLGYSDAQLGVAFGLTEDDVRDARRAAGIRQAYRTVDTCAAEFAARTPYFYSTWGEAQDDVPSTGKPKVVILGGGPNRIGQGIEFDYCCIHAALALREDGYETIMVNCNPETVSTDYDTSDRLYFEPLTLEDVLNIVDVEGMDAETQRGGEGETQRGRDAESVPASLRPSVPASPLLGLIVQFGGQTPLNLARGLAAAGVPILGTSPDAIDLAEDRGRFGTLLAELDIPCPANGIARTLAEARAIARQIGYPVVVRPSYVLGGRAMAVVSNEDTLENYMAQAVAAAEGQPILIDQFLEDAYEIDVDAIGDGERVVIGGVMQHIEEAGIHSGDSACVLPPYKVSLYHLSILRDYTVRLGLALGVRGLMNVQYAIKDDIVYVLEVNPRASRTVPFVSKATGAPLARIATQVMAGKTLAEIGFTEEPAVTGFFVKEAVLPFIKFPEVDAILGPEMRSTGEVMGHAAGFGHAFAKAQMAAGMSLPLAGGVLITVNDFDKGAALKIGRDLHRLGFILFATAGTGAYFHRAGIPATVLAKVAGGEGHYTTLDALRDGKIQLIINTPLGPESRSDGAQLRRLATRLDVPLITTLSAAQAAVNGIRALRQHELRVQSLQEHHHPATAPFAN
ncbi:MAG: carbamoyl-phosphate synthase large subunit [Caldilineales bacterium]|nr:carbamoyl-phosphate synthase large subunit [Caldilineales bacterium]